MSENKAGGRVKNAQNDGFSAKIAMARIMLKSRRMAVNSKTTTGSLALDQRFMALAEPTKFILRCCELRKRRMGPSFLIPAAARVPAKSGN